MTTATENVPIPISMKNFIEGQLPASGFHTAAEYVCELIRKDQVLKAEAQLRDLILIGLNSGVSTPADTAFFDSLEAKVKELRIDIMRVLHAHRDLPTALSGNSY